MNPILLAVLFVAPFAAATGLILLARNGPAQWMPRAWHRRYATWFGYFWLPCPLCREPSGGHEWRPYRGRVDSIPDPAYPPGTGRSIGICPRCTKAGYGWRQRMPIEDVIDAIADRHAHEHDQPVIADCSQCLAWSDELHDLTRTRP